MATIVLNLKLPRAYLSLLVFKSPFSRRLTRNTIAKQTNRGSKICYPHCHTAKVQNWKGLPYHEGKPDTVHNEITWRKGEGEERKVGLQFHNGSV